MESREPKAMSDIATNCADCNAPLWDWVYYCKCCHGAFCQSCLNPNDHCAICAESLDGDDYWEEASGDE